MLPLASLSCHHAQPWLLLLLSASCCLLPAAAWQLSEAAAGWGLLPGNKMLPDTNPDSASVLRLVEREPLSCGTWQQPYVRRHVAAGWRKDWLKAGGSRVVVYDCMGGKRLHNTQCKGLGDMIRGVITAFTFALLTNRVLLINSPVLSHGFASPFVDWRLPPFKRLTLINDSSAASHYQLPSGASVLSLLIMGQGKTSLPTASRLLAAASDSAQVVALRAHRGILNTILLGNDSRFQPFRSTLHSMGLHHPATAFACFMRFLLHPSPAVMSRVQLPMRLLQLPGVASVGIHIRTGDKYFKSFPVEGMEGHLPLLQCAEFVTHHSQQQQQSDGTQQGLGSSSGSGSGGTRRVVWFLASDCKRLKWAMWRQHKEVMIATPFTPKHINRRYRDKTEMERIVEESVGEWALFAQTEFKIFRLSGWSLTASLLTANPSKKKTFIFGGGNVRPDDDVLWQVCNFTSPPQFAELAEKWGGL